MKNEIDFKKPTYINSFTDDELIFNIIRGTTVKSGKYDGSLPVSLDSLQIRKLWNKEYKKEYPGAFRKIGKAKEKEYCDVIVNVNFSDDLDFSEVTRVREDYSENFDPM